MIERELKIQLSAASEAQLRRALTQAPGREGRARTRDLRSIYHDTPDFALAEAGIALRLRLVGKAWVQTIKKRPEEGSLGLFSAVEVDRPAPEGRLDLVSEEAGDVLETVRKAVNGAEVSPVFETRVKRTSVRLRTRTGLVEIAIDRGEVVAGALSAPIREAEFELIEGKIDTVFEAATMLFRSGPLRFSPEPKSARGLRLAKEGKADLPLEPRRAGAVAYSSEAPAAEAARVVLRDCFAQIASNLAVSAESEDPEGPHQLRVGLRRLRTALSAFKDVLGHETVKPIAEGAKRIGREAGRLRDLDVLIGEVLATAAERGLNPELRSALADELETRRRATRDEVRAALSDKETVQFVFALAARAEADGEESVAPEPTIAGLAPQVLGKRYRAVTKRGKRLAELDAEELHDLRKKVKKLRYTIELFTPIYGKKSRRLTKALKALQQTLGAVNDAATARNLLELAPGADWRAQRASGWIGGALAVDAEAKCRRLGKRWKRLAKRAPFWC